MNSTFTFRFILVLTVMLYGTSIAVAQNTSPHTADTMRVIEIIQGKNLREKAIDSVSSLQTIAGDVILKEGLTLFYCDSASINKTTNTLEAFGHVHINQNDSIHTYSQYLKYIGKERVGYLKKDVRLTDNKGTLYTQELEYDLKSSIGKYFNGGKVVNGKTVLTSTEGVYYADTKDVFFKKNVHLVDPKYDVRTDTLLYNTQTQITSWNTPTVIKSKDGGDVYSSTGTYDLKNGKAFFGNRTIIRDSTRTYVADRMASDDSTGLAQLEGNAIIKDSTNGFSVLGRSIFLDKKQNTFLATGKPVLIFKGEAKDSTFIAADTLFSGLEKRDSLGRKIVVSKDTIKKETVVNIVDSTLAKGNQRDSTAVPDSMALVVKDSATNIIALSDSLHPAPVRPIPSVNRAERQDTMANKILVKNHAENQPLPTKKNDSSLAVNNNRVNVPVRDGRTSDSASLIKTDTAFSIKKADSAISSTMAIKTQSQENHLGDTATVRSLKDTAIRYFIAFHNVRIFNDSLQSVCDSLYYSSEDSIFRLFQEPLVFSNNSQIAGDTIYMYTKNKKPARLYVFENGIIINKANEQMYNQVAGRTLNGYFKGGEIDYMRAKGSPAESVYYPQDDDSAYIGMNRSKGDIIDVYFVNKEVNKVKFVNDVDGTLFPIRQIPEDQKYLKNYKWLDKRRPKNKLELFE